MWVLESIFHLSHAQAFAIMMHVHQSGVGIAGRFTRDVAETKVKAAQQLAEQHGCPPAASPPSRTRSRADEPHTRAVRPRGAREHPPRVWVASGSPSRPRRPRAHAACADRRSAGEGHPRAMPRRFPDLADRSRGSPRPRVHAGTRPRGGQAGIDAGFRSRRRARGGPCRLVERTAGGKRRAAGVPAAGGGQPRGLLPAQAGRRSPGPAAVDRARRRRSDGAGDGARRRRCRHRFSRSAQVVRHRFDRQGGGRRDRSADRA